MIRSENTLTHVLKSFSEQIMYTSGVVVADWDDQFIFRTNHTYFKVLITLLGK